MSIDVSEGWTEERIEKLRAFWTEGKSGLECSLLLGGISRNAAIGKVHRLGLPKRDNSSRKNHMSGRKKYRGSELGVRRFDLCFSPLTSLRTSMPRTKKTASLDAEFKGGKTFERPAAVMPAFKRAPRLEGIESEPSGWSNSIGIPLLDLEAHMCRFPLGPTMEPAVLFCGLDCAGTYCEQHQRIAYQAPQIRRRAKDIP